jgi:manganese/zinc/iron transport system permease protein
MLNIQALLIASLIMGVVTTYLTEFLTKMGRLQEDASLGLVFTSLFALGIIAVTILTRSAHIGIEAVMGNADALNPQDCRFVFLILGVNVFLFLLFFKELQLTTFDPGLGRALGFSPTFFNYLLMGQVAMTAISAFRAVGVLMFLAFITGPVLTARQMTHDLKKMMLLAVALGFLATVIGVALARHFLSVYDMALSTGGVVVCVIVAIYAFTLLMSFSRSAFSRSFCATQRD